MRIGRTLPPAAAPISKLSFLRGFQGIRRGQHEIESFRADLKDFFKVEHCFLLSSGKAALTVILRALKALNPERDEILIPAFSCYSVPSAVVRAGLKIRLADMDPHTLDYDFETLRTRLKGKDRLLAAVSIHLFGLPADISKLIETLDDPQITVIEDAAQAMGGVANDKYLGTISSAGFFSLGRGKVFSTAEGGVILTHSDELADIIHEKIKELVVKPGRGVFRLVSYALALSFFIRPSLFWLPKSIPSLKLGETIYDTRFPIDAFASFQAGLASNWRKEMASLQQMRDKNVRYWTQTLTRFPWIQPIIQLNGKMPAYPLIRFPVLIQNTFLREKLLTISEKKGLGIMPSYPGTIDTIDGLKYEFDGEDFHGAKTCADQLVTFPVHKFVSSTDRKKIVDCLNVIQADYCNSYFQTGKTQSN